MECYTTTKYCMIGKMGRKLEWFWFPKSLWEPKGSFMACMRTGPSKYLQSSKVVKKPQAQSESLKSFFSKKASRLSRSWNCLVRHWNTHTLCIKYIPNFLNVIHLHFVILHTYVNPKNVIGMRRYDYFLSKSSIKVLYLL